MRTRFEGPESDHLYVRLDPLAGGTGGGGTDNAGANSASARVASDGDLVPAVQNTNTTTHAINRTYAVPTFEALESSHGFSSASVGYAGTASDGLTMLDDYPQLTTFTRRLTDTSSRPPRSAPPRPQRGPRARLRQHAITLRCHGRRCRGPRVRLRSSGATSRSGGATTRACAARRAASAQPRCVSITSRSTSSRQARTRRSPARSPPDWRRHGGSRSRPATLSNGKPTYFGSYREVFARDLYEAFAGLLVAGDIGTARDAARFLFDRQQQPDGSMPRNSLLNGKVAPDTGGLQLDETSYPILMAWQSGLAGDSRALQPARDSGGRLPCRPRPVRRR